MKQGLRSIADIIAPIVERAKPLDPRDPDPTREGMFQYHNCYKCQHGAKPCVNGNPRGCEFPQARND